MICTVIEYNNELYLVSPSNVKKVTFDEIRECIYNMDFSNYMRKTRSSIKNQSEIMNGRTLLVHTEDNILEIHDHHFLRNLMSPQITGTISPADFAMKYGCKLSAVYRFCREGRIPGVKKYNNTWYIPETATYPTDRRAGRDMSKRYSTKNEKTPEEV